MASDQERKTNGWNEWAKKVLSDIEAAKEDISELYSKNTALNLELVNKINALNNSLLHEINELNLLITKKFAIIETKASQNGAFWGAIVGILCSIITSIIAVIVTRVVGGQ